MAEAQVLLKPFPNMVEGFGSWPQWRKNMGLGPHRGSDFECGFRDPIPAAGSGVCTSEGWDDAVGWWVVIRYSTDSGDVYIGSCHMAERTHLRYGVWVSRGERIGYAGNTGTATTGTHLHQTASRQNGNPAWVPVIDVMQFYAAAGVAGTVTVPIENRSKMKGHNDMYLVREVNGTVYLQTPNGRAKIGSPQHLALFNRMFNTYPGADTFNALELDVIQSYVMAASQIDDGETQRLVDAIGKVSAPDSAAIRAAAAEGARAGAIAALEQANVTATVDLEAIGASAAAATEKALADDLARIPGDVVRAQGAALSNG